MPLSIISKEQLRKSSPMTVDIKPVHLINGEGFIEKLCPVGLPVLAGGAAVDDGTNAKGLELFHVSGSQDVRSRRTVKLQRFPGRCRLVRTFQYQLSEVRHRTEARHFLLNSYRKVKNGRLLSAWTPEEQMIDWFPGR